jgi:hypothetical protein
VRTLVLAILALAGAPGSAPADDWPYDDRYASSLLYLHETLDYAFHPLWVRQWERNLVSGNGLRGTAGSLTTDDLITVLQVDVAQPAGRGFRVLYVADRFEAPHRDVLDREQFVGLEAPVLDGFGIQLLADPMTEKEELDALAGIVLANSARESYLRLWLRLDDPVWGRKNDRGGRSVQEAIGPQWTARLARGPWEFFSAGRSSRPSQRAFDDPVLSPDVAAEERRRGESESRLRWTARGGSWAEAALAHWAYEETIEARDPAGSYAYENRIVRGRLAAGSPESARWGGRAELHHVRQDAEAQGAHDYAYERRDLPWALHLEWRPTPAQVWDLGYLRSRYEWDYAPRDGTTPFDAAGGVDKVKLAWTFLFSQEARMLLGLSHEPEASRFGGGNLQLQAIF